MIEGRRVRSRRIRPEILCEVRANRTLRIGDPLGTLHSDSTTTRMASARSYDRLNRLMGISSIPAEANQLPLSFQYSYNDANQRIRVGLHDGSYWLYEYDALG